MPVFTCKNHREKLWYNTHEGGKVVFMGDLRKDGSIKDAHPMAPIPHMTLLKAYINGYNPFAPELKEDPHIKTVRDVRNFLKYVDTMNAKWAFECDCEPGNRERVDGDPDELLQKVAAS
jgi:hypothetical protein